MHNSFGFYPEGMKRTKGYRSLTTEKQGQCESMNCMCDYVHIENPLLEQRCYLSKAYYYNNKPLIFLRELKQSSVQYGYL